MEKTIEQKAKAYDEAIEKLRNLYDNYDSISTLIDIKEELEHIFPELCESEDEKIRKEILEVAETVVSCDGTLYGKKYNCREWIAWLEKQGEKPQGKTYTFEGKSVLEAIDNINKVEPKFKVGDFIVNDYCAGKVIALTDDAYLLDTGQGIPFSYEYNARLWTIQDAKPGDVLATDKSVFIYAKTLYNKPYAYCGVDKYGVFKDNCLKNNWANSVNNILPANKEQRDTLMKAMADAGYTFDFEKKELKKVEDGVEKAIHEASYEWLEDTHQLKKIEQEPLQWNISDYKTWQYIVSDVLTKHDGIGQYLDDGFCKKIAQYMQEEWSKKLSLGQNLTWSEEDEKRLKSCLNILQPKTLLGNTETINTKWLKSFKQRYTWKPSDVQMQALKEACDKHWEPDGLNPLYTLYEQLKMLTND